MKFQLQLFYSALICVSTSSLYASEFDQFLQKNNVIDHEFKIQDKKQLNEILDVLSAEDSKTLPIKIDQNIIIEQFNLSANKTEIKGLIITPDFTQFELEMGSSEVKKLIRNNIQKNCAIFYEHQYQKANPYSVKFELSSPEKSYELELTQKDCKL